VLRFDGKVWQAAFVDPTQSFNAIWGASATDLFVAGSSGTIYRGAGSSWAKLNSGVTSVIRSLWGTGPSDLWAAAWGAILHFDGTCGATARAPCTPSATTARCCG
jgi:hypothetical protein